MTFHIGAKPGEIAETVLLPGDPYRARWAAETFLENPVLVNEVRGMLGYTGFWRGHRVTIHGSGMGMPSLSIYANELIRDFGAQTLIRIGSAGALQPHVKIRDVVLAQAATTLGSPSRSIFRELNFALAQLVEDARKANEKQSGCNIAPKFARVSELVGEIEPRETEPHRKRRQNPSQKNAELL